MMLLMKIMKKTVKAVTIPITPNTIVMKSIGLRCSV